MNAFLEAALTCTLVVFGVALPLALIITSAISGYVPTFQDLLLLIGVMATILGVSLTCAMVIIWRLEK